MLEMNLEYWGVTREMTQLRTHWGRQNLFLQMGVQLTKSLVRKHTGQEVCSGFIPNAMLPFAWIGQVLGSQSTRLADLKADRLSKELWRKEVQKFSETIAVLGHQLQNQDIWQKQELVQLRKTTLCS
jgi:hypothetical protein